MTQSHKARNSVIAVATLLTLAAAGSLAISVAMAEETPDWGDLLEPRGANAFDPETLVRFEGASYRVAYDPSVSTDAIERSAVQKIAFGRLTTVDVTTTTTGTYSSEALFSPHVRYPGIEVERVTDDAALLREDYREPGAFIEAGSFVSIAPTANGAIIITDRTICVLARNTLIC